MRTVILLLAASSGTQATWLRWSVNQDTVWAAKETGHVTETEQVGWTPRPTAAPGARSEGEEVLSLLRKRQASSTDWTNSETCGWFSGISSSAYACGNGFTCATNSNHAVACASGTISPFFTACLDYSAYQAGSCISLDPATGCCQQKTQPACGTYIWTGQPERFMYQCFESASIISMLDVPQFVVDASIFSKTHTTPTPTPTSTESGASNVGSASPPDNTNGSGSGSDSGSGSGSGTSPANPASDSGNTTITTSGSNTPAIVGGVVGGVIGLLLLLLLWWYMRRKTKGKLGLGFTSNKKNKKEKDSRKAYHTTNIGGGATAKGRTSSGSETTATVAPIQMKVQPQHQYPNREVHHYHTESVAQRQPQHLQLHQQYAPQTNGPADGQQPVSVSYTVKDGATHARHPSYTSNTTYNNTELSAPSAAPHHVVVGGLMSHHSKESKSQHEHAHRPPVQHAQHVQHTQEAQSHQMMPSQVQPINHFHVYLAPPPVNGEQNGPHPAPQQPSPDTNITTHSQASSVVNALGVSMQSNRERSLSPDQASRESHSRQHASQYPGSNANANAQTKSTATAAAGAGAGAAASAAVVVDVRGASAQSNSKRSASPPEQSPQEARDRDQIYGYYSHSRDTSAHEVRSGSPGLEWLGARGPGYRQSL